MNELTLFTVHSLKKNHQKLVTLWSESLSYEVTLLLQLIIATVCIIIICGWMGLFSHVISVRVQIDWTHIVKAAVGCPIIKSVAPVKFAYTNLIYLLNRAWSRVYTISKCTTSSSIIIHIITALDVSTQLFFWLVCNTMLSSWRCIAILHRTKLNHLLIYYWQSPLPILFNCSFSLFTSLDQLKCWNIGIVPFSFLASLQQLNPIVNWISTITPIIITLNDCNNEEVDRFCCDSFCNWFNTAMVHRR